MPVFMRECYLIFPAIDTKRKVIRSFDYHRNLCPLVYCILKSDKNSASTSCLVQIITSRQVQIIEPWRDVTGRKLNSHT